MVNRVETIELTGNTRYEVMEEFINDVKKKRDEGWELLTYSYKYFNRYEFCMKYEMVRMFPFEVNKK